MLFPQTVNPVLLRRLKPVSREGETLKRYLISLAIDFLLGKGGSMSAKERFDFLETNAAILESISKQYGIDSMEYSSLKNAGIALSFVVMEEYERFKKYLADFDQDREFTPEERARLIQMGIDPDADPESP